MLWYNSETDDFVTFATADDFCIGEFCSSNGITMLSSVSRVGDLMGITHSTSNSLVGNEFAYKMYIFRSGQLCPQLGINIGSGNFSESLYKIWR